MFSSGITKGTCCRFAWKNLWRFVGSVEFVVVHSDRKLIETTAVIARHPGGLGRVGSDEQLASDDSRAWDAIRKSPSTCHGAHVHQYTGRIIVGLTKHVNEAENRSANGAKLIYRVHLQNHSIQEYKISSSNMLRRSGPARFFILFPTSVSQNRIFHVLHTPACVALFT